MTTSLASSSGHYLNVLVKQAKEIKATNFFSTTASDSFCEVYLRDQNIQQTQVKPATTSPVWEETLQFLLPENPNEETLFVTVWGHHVLGRNTFIGRVEIPVCLLITETTVDADQCGSTSAGTDPALLKFDEKRHLTKWFKLLPKSGTNVQYDKVPGWIELDFSYSYIPVVTSNQFSLQTDIQRPNFSETLPKQHQAASIGNSGNNINYNNPNLAMYSSSAPFDTSVPSGFSPDPSQPPSSPPARLYPSMSMYKSPNSSPLSSPLQSPQFSSPPHSPQVVNQHFHQPMATYNSFVPPPSTPEPQLSSHRTSQNSFSPLTSSNHSFYSPNSSTNSSIPPALIPQQSSDLFSSIAYSAPPPSNSDV